MIIFAMFCTSCCINLLYLVSWINFLHYWKLHNQFFPSRLNKILLGWRKKMYYIQWYITCEDQVSLLIAWHMYLTLFMYFIRIPLIFASVLAGSWNDTIMFHCKLIVKILKTSLVKSSHCLEELYCPKN